MALHISSIHFRGNHASNVVRLLEQLKYRVVGAPAEAATGDLAAQLLEVPTGNRNVVRKAIYQANGWTYLIDPELVVMSEDGALTEFAREHEISVFSWVCEGVSATYGFALYSPTKVREVLAVDGEVLSNSGAALPEERGQDWSAASEPEIIELASRLGAGYDYLSVNRDYTILTLDESVTALPNTDNSTQVSAGGSKHSESNVRLVDPGRDRPWWKLW